MTASNNLSNSLFFSPFILWVDNLFVVDSSGFFPVESFSWSYLRWLLLANQELVGLLLEGE